MSDLECLVYCNLKTIDKKHNDLYFQIYANYSFTFDPIMCESGTGLVVAQ